MALQFVKRSDIVSGMWKFKAIVKGVSIESDLRKLAIEWKVAEPHNYLDLHIRKCSKDQVGIGFQYHLAGRHADSNEFIVETQDALKRRFGNDLVGWDIGYSTWVLEEVGS